MQQASEQCDCGCDTTRDVYAREKPETWWHLVKIGTSKPQTGDIVFASLQCAARWLGVAGTVDTYREDFKDLAVYDAPPTSIRVRLTWRERLAGRVALEVGVNQVLNRVVVSRKA